MDLIKIGRLLCDLRKAKGLTQKEVADRLGVLPKTVSKKEKTIYIRNNNIIA